MGDCAGLLELRAVLQVTSREDSSAVGRLGAAFSRDDVHKRQASALVQSEAIPESVLERIR